MSSDTGAEWVCGPVWSNPERMGGAVCFNGTRVPVQTLFDYVSQGYSVDEFLDHFPPITRAQVDDVLRMAGDLMGRVYTSSRANAA